MLGPLKFGVNCAHSMGNQHYRRHKRHFAIKNFLEGQSHRRRPRTSTTEEKIEAIRNIIEGDRRLTVAEIHQKVEISHGSVLLEKVRVAYRSKRRGFRIRDVLLLHDNARPYTANQKQQKLAELFWIALEHPSYSPNLSPCDYHMFGSLKEMLGGERFDGNERVEQFVCNWGPTCPHSFYDTWIKYFPSPGKNA